MAWGDRDRQHQQLGHHQFRNVLPADPTATIMELGRVTQPVPEAARQALEGVPMILM